MTEELVRVEKLAVLRGGTRGHRRILEDISFSIRRAEVLALVGESGCGKTTLAYALTRLFPASAEMEIRGTAWMRGRDLFRMSEEELLEIRRHDVRYILQEPAQAFSPVRSIEEQFRACTSAANAGGHPPHDPLIESQLRRAGIDEPSHVLHAYPHELSVGTLQRVLIAMATATSPFLLIADEPTSAIDAPLRRQVLDLIVSFRNDSGLSILLITHDLAVAEGYADRIAVLYAGRIVEIAPRAAFFERPLHPYSQLLVQYALASLASIDDLPPLDWFGGREGFPPEGCLFYPRCRMGRGECRISEPPLESPAAERYVRCPYWK